MPEEELEDIELIGLVEGTVDDLKQYIRENDLDDEELEKILQAERDAKDRKTAKGFLRNRMDRQPKVDEDGGEKDTEDAEERAGAPEELEVEDDGIEREELLRMLGGTVEEMKEWVREKDPSDEQLQEILHAEKIVNDRKTAVSFLKSYSKREELKEDIKEAERDFQELRNDLDRIEEVLDEDIDLSGIELDRGELQTEEQEETETEEESEEDAQSEPDDDGEKEGDEGGGDGEKDTEDAKEAPEDGKDEGKEEETGEGGEEDEAEEAGGKPEDGDEDAGEDDEESGDGEDDEKSTLEKKKEIAEELDTELSEEQLEDISLGELKSIRDEKEEREKLIAFLDDEFDEEKLREASTDDLRKLKQNVQESKEDGEKAGEEIKEEAQEDLEMLMGAVRDKDDGEEDKDRLKGLKDLHENISEKLSFRSGKDEEEDDNGMAESDVIDLLEDYQELGRYESAIKTAHIMKGFLEYSEGIDRELTYRELTEEIDARTEEMELLLDFFDDMHKDQYTGDIDADMDEVIDAAKTVVRERG